jgi:hypothetical protein
MVRLTTCGDAFEARLLAARLGSEGVVWSLRGAHDGPLALGTVDVLVDAGDLAVARELLGDTADASGWELAAEDAEPEPETTGRDVLVVCAVLLFALLFAVARMAAV